jgi:ABC-2 type transport system permease protein
MSALGLVVRRELREALGRRSFWVVCGLVLLGSSAGMVLPSVLDRGPTVDHVALAGDGNGALGAAVRAVDEHEVRVQPVPDARAARAAVDDGRADVGIAVGAGDAATLYVKAGQHQTLVAIAQEVLAAQATTRRLEGLGLSAPQVRDALQLRPGHVVELDTKSASRRGSAAIVSTVLYILLLMLMITAANGVAIEKANRISEVLLAIVRPVPLLFGKVIGVGIVGLLTLACGAAPVVVKLAAGGHLPTGLAPAVAGSAAWLVLGLALYLTCAGALGALVERQEDAGTTAAPLSIVLIGSYLLAQSAPESPVAGVLAYVPFSSPVVMPARLAVGASSPLEMAGSLVLGVGAVALAGRVGSLIYRRAIVQTGRKLKVTDVLRA